MVPVNPIDLSSSAFLNLASNPIVFATMVSIMCLYVSLCVWARKKDKEDEIKVSGRYTYSCTYTLIHVRAHELVHVLAGTFTQI